MITIVNILLINSFSEIFFKKNCLFVSNSLMNTSDTKINNGFPISVPGRNFSMKIIESFG